MLRRELAVALGSPTAWLAAAVGALIVGHSFVLALDLYAAASRSVVEGALMAREFDPLLGVARPTYGGADFCLTLLGPTVAARVLAIEKERRTLHARLLAVASPLRLLLAKTTAAAVALTLLLVPVLFTMLLWTCSGGQLGAAELVTLLAGGLLHALLLASLATAAAAWTRGAAQATTVALALSLSAWVIDAGSDFAALAWLGPLTQLSWTPRLQPFEQALLLPGSVAWLLCATAGAVAMGYLGLRGDWTVARRGAKATLVAVTTVVGLRASDALPGGWDLSEAQRASFPAPLLAALRGLPGPIELDIYLDRDDSRRPPLERDVLRRLQLSRRDVAIRFPIDEAADPATAVHDADYGKLEIRVAGAPVQTWSTSRKEIVELIFQAAGEKLGAWEYSSYPGYPRVVEGGERRTLALLAYLTLPLGCIAAGLFTLRRSKRS